MIRCVLVHDGGLIIAVGIVEANIKLLKARRPLHLELGKILKELSPEDFGEEGGVLSLLISYGDTHVEIVDRWNEELRHTGLRLGDQALEDAAKLDEQLRAEGLI